MDSHLSRPQPTRLVGRTTILVPFDNRHLQNPRYLDWLSNYDVMKTIGRSEYLTAIPYEEVEEYVRQLTESMTDMFFAVHLRDEDTFVGTVKAGHIDWRAGIADIGIMIGERDMWGRGIATDALATLCKAAFDGLGMRKLVANIMAANPAMMRVFEKLGFQREGVRRRHMPFEGSYTDLILYGCFLEEFRHAQAG